MRRAVKAFISLLLVLLSLPTYVAAQQDCQECHQATVAAGDIRIYLHIPFAQRQCGECHTAEVLEPGSAEESSRLVKKSQLARKKITWHADSQVAATSHSFVLPAKKLGETLVVEKKSSGGVIQRDEIAVPQLVALEGVVEEGQPPDISDVKVLKVQRGVFLSVTIGWQTDTLCRPMVEYGENSFTQKSQPSKRFGRQHQVTLASLKPDRNYNYRVSAVDLFGRTATSETLRFSTRKPLDSSGASSSGSSAERKVEQEILSRFRRLGPNYLVELSGAEPFLAFVGSAGKVKKQAQARSRQDFMGAKGQHKKLSSKSFSTIRACQNCHSTQNAVTHPINVFPKSDMTIPPEYPTLADGRITCATCHATHGSDNEYLAIKPGRRELCVGCHKDML